MSAQSWVVAVVDRIETATRQNSLDTLLSRDRRVRLTSPAVCLHESAAIVTDGLATETKAAPENLPPPAAGSGEPGGSAAARIWQKSVRCSGNVRACRGGSSRSDG